MPNVGCLTEGLASLRAAWRVPGVGVTVVHGDEAAVLVDGIRDASTGTPLTPRTLFPLGSLTKSLIAAFTAQLVEQGLTDWETRQLIDVLPHGAPRDGYTLTQLLTHSSGMPSYDMLLAGCADTTPGDAARRRLPHLVTVRAPGGKRHSYSDLAYLLTCHIAEEATGRPWHGLIGNFLSELGARDPRAEQDDDLVHGHRLDDAGEFTDSGPPRLHGLSAVLSGLWASPEDMTALLRFHLSGHGVRHRLLGEQALEHLRTPRTAAPSASANHPAHVVAEGYGHGWLAGRYRRARILVHSSSVGAVRGMTVVVPERRLAVNVFCNIGVRHSPGRAHCCFRCAVAFSLIDALSGRETGMADRLPARKPERMAGTTPGRRVDSCFLTELMGTYHHPGFGRVRLAPSMNGGGTVFIFGPVVGEVHRDPNGVLYTMCPVAPGPIAITPAGSDRLAVRMERSVPAFEFIRVVE
ncbi:serine hydrolase domain-containing protein [Streptomyces sp. SLBN-115]|uniref:serine hydrolase domain-containing protein n=1 Tax=Streptomyces sp. SLBN-115 TaxID=2768453 RepID=UPI00116A4CA1|nr:serine hydrolase domain-containing protein [Streptomyces sp. SLBN-115]TQJ37052.1 CubicO group peptidase (beta-lactamase class C family) [Streptomyces sp. SLBN-115]